ncbi:kinase-like domain-containing protein, partial [Ochromonadaceae sp. CCMP2298]
SFTDVVTVIEMRDGAVVTIDKEPITWELHNKIVDLADEPLRAGGQGNYLPALQMSSKVLRSIKDENCALLLLFLSDGGPSDHCTLFGNVQNSFDRANAAIRGEVYEICRRFGARLTFGAFGFAHDKENSRGEKTFDLLRVMEQVARAAGSQAVFACGLDTDSLRRALFTMASSLQRTRNSLSSLAGGSLLRVTGRKVKRTDLKKDISGSESGSMLLCDHDFHFTNENGLRRAVPRRSRSEREGTIMWDFVPLQHPEARGIAVKKGYIEHGGERAAYEMTEVTADRVPVGQTLVGKLSIHEEPSQVAFHKRCAVTQYEATRLADRFNVRLEELWRTAGILVPHIEFLPVWFYDWFAADGSEFALLCERRLDSTRYKKWNDNRGGVFHLNMRLEPEAVDDGDDAEDEEEDPAPGAVSAAALSEFASRIIDEDVPQAFSHWTYNYSHRESLVCDIQGVLGNSFQLTDPSIHSSTHRFGPTDHGRNGQRNFFKTHECNPLCRVLHLRPAAAAQPAVKGPSSSWLSRQVQKV